MNTGANARTSNWPCCNSLCCSDDRGNRLHYVRNEKCSCWFAQLRVRTYIDILCRKNQMVLWSKPFDGDTHGGVYSACCVSSGCLTGWAIVANQMLCCFYESVCQMWCAQGSMCAMTNAHVWFIWGVGEVGNNCYYYVFSFACWFAQLRAQTK